MATSKEKRAWLAGNGHPQIRDGRGRIPAALLAEYDQAHPPPPADDYAPSAPASDFLDEPLLSVGADELEPPPELEPPATAAPEEERPTRPRAARPGWSFGGRRRSGRGRAQSARKTRTRTRKVFARVSIGPLIEDTYADLAWAAGGIPPLQRLLYAQAPIAGVVLDPVVQGTFVDPVVQLAARNYERGKVVMALVGTPAALMATLATAPQPLTDPQGKPVLVPVLDEDEQPTGQTVLAMEPATVQHQTAMISLRYCVRAMADVAGGDSLERVTQRAEANAARDDQVNTFIAYLLGMGEVPPEAADTAAREARDAGLRLAGATIGE